MSQRTRSSIRPVGIFGTGSYLPERVFSNEDYTKYVDTSDEWIVQRTGMRERRFAADDQATSDLATIAAQRALEDAGWVAEDLFVEHEDALVGVERARRGALAEGARNGLHV